MDMTPQAASPRKRIFFGRLRWLNVKENLIGYAFVAPATILIAIFGLFPIGYAVYMSLYNWQVRQGNFVGPDNYTKALGDWTGVTILIAGFVLLALAYWAWRKAFQSHSTWRLIGFLALAILLIGAGLAISLGWTRISAAGDQDFLRSIPTTIFFALGAIPLELFLGLGLAYVLYQNIRGKSFFRMLYFLPYVMPIVATAVVFRLIFSPRDSSIANQFLAAIGQAPQRWLFEPRPFLQVAFGVHPQGFLAGPSMALVSVIIFSIWTYTGYNTVIFLAGLSTIPNELYEAAEIDGANSWNLFRHITLPLLSPVTFYLALIGLIGALKAFNSLYVMRTPSALGTLDTTSLVVFDTFYKANQYGYAAAEAILLFLIILAFTIAQNKLFGEKVFYG
jgi:ABC-type sugar transport system permease subunit